MEINDVASNQIKNNRNVIIFLTTSGVVNKPMKYFTIKRFWEITKKDVFESNGLRYGIYHALLRFSRNSNSVDKYVAHECQGYPIA